jgi:hypothetical protein
MQTPGDRPYDQNTSQRLLPDFGTQELMRKIHIRCTFILGPLGQVLTNEENVISAPVDFGQVGFEDRFT